MSCYESENGNIIFNKTNANKFIMAMRKEYNLHQDFLYSVALHIYEKLQKVKGTVKRFENRESFFSNGGNYLYKTPLSRTLVTHEDMDNILSELFRNYKFYTDKKPTATDKKLFKPRKSAFKKITNKEKDFYINEHIHISESGATWGVEENNHAVDTANNEPMSIAFFHYLNKHDWKRNEGGVFYYQSEYTRDAARENGDSAEDISRHFGSIGKKTIENRYRMYM